MRRWGLFACALAAAVCRAEGEDAGVASTCALDVAVSGLKDGGNVWVILYDDAKAFPTKRDRALKRIDAAPKAGEVKVAFEGLKCGVDYAVAVVHDENGNGKLDSNFLFIPIEGLGSSRDAKGSLGPPSFSDAKLRVNSGRLAVPIRIKY